MTEERDTLPGEEPRQARVPPGARRPYLLVLSGPQFGDLVELAPGQELFIGRRADAAISIPDEGVSRRHAAVTAGDDHAVLRDLGSQNGTWVEGERISERRLSDGQRFQLGAHTTLKFVCCDEVDADYQRKLAQGALLEPLTGLYNRRYFLERMSVELAAARRHGLALSLLLLDVDHFKLVNDRLGHAAGDEALRMLARVLLGALRKEDVLARFGGEEFIVLAREATLAGAHALGERIRKAVERSRFSFDGAEVALTASVGVTVFGGEAADGELLETADRALYRAKRAGRNAVVSLPTGG